VNATTMKVLHILYSGLGGHGNVFSSMVLSQVANEFDHEALFYGVEPLRQEFIDLCNRQVIPWNYVKKNVKLDLKYYYRIYRLIRKSKPDVIFVHGSGKVIPARLAKMFSGKKQKIIVRETQANHLKTATQWVALSASMLLAHRIVCLTEEFKLQVKRKLGWLFRAKKVMVIPNGINLHTYQPSANSRNQSRIIGMQSRLQAIKDHTTLLKAFALLPEEERMQTKLKIAGDGDYKNVLISEASALGIAERVEFTGTLSEDELVDFLNSLDLYVHASLGETMSTAIMQAMACRLPVVASDVSGINNMIQDGITGILVPPQHEEKLANAIQQCLHDPALCESLAKNAWEFAQCNFSNESMMAAYKRIFL